jgi:hypothetical protein
LANAVRDRSVAPRPSYSGSAGTSTSPRSFATRSTSARQSASPICSLPSVARICGPRSKYR